MAVEAEWALVGCNGRRPEMGNRAEIRWSDIISVTLSLTSKIMAGGTCYDYGLEGIR